jgi:hypothetical protein
MRNPLLAIAGMAVLSGTPAGCADTLPLDGASIEALIKGNTLSVRNLYGEMRTAHLRADGTARVRDAKDGAIRTARWRILGDTVCHGIRPVYKCYRVQPDEEDGYVAQSLDNA